jgi:hypothetical protein
LKLAWGAWNWTLESNKRNQVKEMDGIAIPKSFMGGIFPYFKKINKNYLHFNIGM